ncbi:uncharacterized protein LOC34621360 [Cyclospora cayetanensis]|uniref:Uncharacterized protein LOC34621360 n=1 Tax=Cyclospora cayetanensis TaxID=88456 RepID=A0A6P6RUC9_9EIME|nr:uncharacterized protein LOC34621360 [Cyclospora cayetanensis]
METGVCCYASGCSSVASAARSTLRLTSSKPAVSGEEPQAVRRGDHRSAGAPPVQPTAKGTAAPFSAERFHSAGPLQWLECLKSLAAAAKKMKGKMADAPVSVSPSVFGGFGWGHGDLPPSLLLWRGEQRLQQLSAGQLVLAATALQQLDLRQCLPSLRGGENGATSDVALLILQLLHKHVRRDLRCLSLRQIGAAAHTLSLWRFTHEDAAAAASSGLQQQHSFTPAELRRSTFRLFLHSASEQLENLSKQQQKQQGQALQPTGCLGLALPLLHACTRLQLTELRESYLVLLRLPILQQQVESSSSLLQLALLLHCSTRLLLHDAPLYRQLLLRLADWDAFWLLLQQERQPAAAQVAFGQLALCCVAFAPWQMDALEVQQQQQQHTEQHCLSTTASGSNAVSRSSAVTGSSGSCTSSCSRLSELQDDVLLNVLRASASVLQWPTAARVGGAAAAATSTRCLGLPSAFLLRQLQIAALALGVERSRLARALGQSVCAEGNPTFPMSFSAREGVFSEQRYGGEQASSPGKEGFEGGPLQDVKDLVALLQRWPLEKGGSSRLCRSSSSEQHASVAAAARALGVSVQQEAPVGPYEADLLLKDRHCIVEIDGPLHFMRPPPQHTRTFRNGGSSSSGGAADDFAALPRDPYSSRKGTGTKAHESSTSRTGLWGSLSSGEGAPPENSPLVYDVRTALKHRLLRSCGWQVLHIAWNDWPVDCYAQQRALAEALKHVERQAPQKAEVGVKWEGCGASLLVYRPQSLRRFLHQAQGVGLVETEAPEEEHCECSLV